MQPRISTRIVSVFRSLGPVRPMLFSKVKRSHITRILCRVSGLVFRRVITSLYKNLPIYPCVHISVNIWISEGEVKRGGNGRVWRMSQLQARKKTKKRQQQRDRNPLWNCRHKCRQRDPLGKIAKPFCDDCIALTKVENKKESFHFCSDSLLSNSLRC